MIPNLPKFWTAEREDGSKIVFDQDFVVISGKTTGNWTKEQIAEARKTIIDKFQAWLEECEAKILEKAKEASPCCC